MMAITNNLHAQTEESEGMKLLKKSYKQLDLMDYKPLKTNYLLNKGFFFGQGLDVYTAFSNNDREKNIVFNSPNTFLKHLVCIKRSEMNEEFLITEEAYIDFLDNVNEEENIVPIGFIQVEGEWLQGYEVDENVEAKKQNQEINKIYDKLNIYSASVLVSQVATPQVNFVLDEFVYFNEKDKIKKIEIDFGDGEGYRPVSGGDEIYIDYGYPGEKAIAIKMKTKKGDFFNYSAINILDYERVVPDEVIYLSDSQRKAVTRDGLSGGRADLFIGCDGALDKPVIFVEGWDALNVRGVSEFQMNNVPSELRALFRNAGFDMIYLNFDDGGADIRTNSVVLQNLIQDVNNQKIGNEKMVIIGASMGGLVARHAIRTLEIANYTHNISHYISFDSPHKGANLPLGAQSLVENAEDIFIRQVFGIAQSAFDAINQMLNSKAAQQMLIRYKGPDPDPSFTEFQNILDNLGFPNQGGIRNVSIVHGNENGTQQSPTNDYDPGDKIIAANWLTILPILGTVYADIDVWTNSLNQNDKVSQIFLFTNIIPTLSIKKGEYDFDGLNYDIAPGGKVPFELSGNLNDLENSWWAYFNVLEWFGGSTIDYQNNRGKNICHSPLFSTTASTENITSQTQLNRSIQSIKSNGFTPFDEIYSANVNTFHTDSEEIIPVWEELLEEELNIIATTSCSVSQGTMGRAPTPYFNGNRFYMCEFDRRVVFYNVDNAPTTIGNLYTLNWTSTGPEPFPPSGGERYTYSYPTSGFYTLSLTRSYESEINGQTSFSYSRVIRSYPHWDPNYGCDESGPIRSTSENEIKEDNNSLNVYPNPNTLDKLTVEFQLDQKEEFDISIQSIDGSLSNRKILLQGNRNAGSYSELFDISEMATGVYIVMFNTSSKQKQQKLIIQKL